MKDMKIEYRDGKLIELVIDGERQDARTMTSISLSHEAGGLAQLQIRRHYHLMSQPGTDTELIEK